MEKDGFPKDSRTNSTANSNDQSKQQGASQSTSQGIVVHALNMAMGTMSSRVLGLLRDQLLAAFFSRTVTDAWAAAFRLPNMFRRLLGEGSLSVSFVPIFVHTRLQDPDHQQSQNLVNSFYSILLIVLTTLTSIGILFPEPFLNVLLDDNYSQISGKFELTVRMARIMFGFIFLMSTYAFFMGILNALGKFALAAFAPTLWNVAMIISTVLPQNWFPQVGDGLAWGVLAGGVLQVGILIPALRREGYLPRLTFNLRHSGALQVWRNMIPGMLGTGLSHITTVVNLRFMSSLGEGPITFVYFADRLLELPLSLVSVSLGTALLPTLTHLWAQNKKQEAKDTSHYYLRLNWFVAVPAAVGLFMLSQPILRVLFQHGKFGPEDVRATTVVLQVYSLTVLVVSSVRVLVPSFYAMKNTWLPATVSGLCLLVHVILAPILMRQDGLRGLVVSSLISSTLNLVCLALAYNRLVFPMGWIRLLMGLWRTVIAGLGMVMALVVMSLPSERIPDTVIAQGIYLAVRGSLALAVYLVISYFLKSEEMHKTIGVFAAKIRRRLKSG